MHYSVNIDILITFPSPSTFWHWRRWRSRISHEPSDILLTCTLTVGHSFSLFLGLHAPGWLYVLGIPPRADHALWTPRERATDLGQGPNLRARPGRAPCMRRSREHEERPVAGREKNAEGAKKHIYIYIYMYKVPFRDLCHVKSRGWRKLKMDTQVTQQQ